MIVPGLQHHYCNGTQINPSHSSVLGRGTLTTARSYLVFLSLPHPFQHAKCFLSNFKLQFSSSMNSNTECRITFDDSILTASNTNHTSLQSLFLTNCCHPRTALVIIITLIVGPTRTTSLLLLPRMLCYRHPYWKSSSFISIAWLLR